MLAAMQNTETESYKSIKAFRWLERSLSNSFADKTEFLHEVIDTYYVKCTSKFNKILHKFLDLLLTLVSLGVYAIRGKWIEI